MNYNDDPIKTIRLAAGKGRPDAQYQLGVYYRDCTDGHCDVRKAVKWLWRAACQEEKRSLSDLQEMAEDNNVEAQFLLGKMYAEGTGVERNDKMACDYLKRASEGKYRTAALYYALHLKTGAREKVINNQEDAEKIYKWLMFVYEDGQASDQCWLAKLLGSEMYRYDSERFRISAIKLYVDAAEKDYQLAWRALEKIAMAESDYPKRFSNVAIDCLVNEAKRHYGIAWHVLEQIVAKEAKIIGAYDKLYDWEKRNKDIKGEEPHTIATNRFKALLKQYKKRVITH